MEIEVKTAATLEVVALQVDAGVRYWEDATVNGVEDEDGSLIPRRAGDRWYPLIELDTGRVAGWPKGTVAKIHYKICDDGIYSLIDGAGDEVATKDGYVPSMLSPGGGGYGDYIIMTINGDGMIEGWSADLGYFEDPE